MQQKLPVVDDHVYFSIVAPCSVRPGTVFEFTVWSYVEAQRKEALQRAINEVSNINTDIRIKSKGPVKVSRGTILTVRLRIQELTVDPPEDTIYWEGEIGNATFLVSVPDFCKCSTCPGTATILVNGLQIARLFFIIQIGDFSREKLTFDGTRIHTAFASYASEDLEAVLARIQGIQKVVPTLDIFIDVAKLRSGENWRVRLEQEIIHRDILYLFWSKAAQKSKWVEWEWRFGLAAKGIDFIDPVPLVSPREAPPPSELADQLHFNDWVLAYISPTTALIRENPAKNT